LKRDTDVAVRVTVAAGWADIVGVVLMDSLGTYAEEPASEGAVTLSFYPVDAVPSQAELLALLPAEAVAQACITVRHESVPRDWVDGWKDHFHPAVIGRVRVRPPWEPPRADEADQVDVVINPGLAFGTGLHPTTRGTLTLLQEGMAAGGRGPLVDAGTGSGILAIAAAKLGWGPVIAFDNDAVALVSAHENIERNGVARLVQMHECGLEEAPLAWFEGATVLANLTLEPVLLLLRRLHAARPLLLVVSGVLAGAQEDRLAREAAALGFAVGRRLYEAEWVSMGLAPASPGEEG
jgi:ribosomal protein L11 methyltransferase